MIKTKRVTAILLTIVLTLSLIFTLNACKSVENTNSANNSSLKEAMEEIGKEIAENEITADITEETNQVSGSVTDISISKPDFVTEGCDCNISFWGDIVTGRISFVINDKLHTHTWKQNELNDSISCDECTFSKSGNTITIHMNNADHTHGWKYKIGNHDVVKTNCPCGFSCYGDKYNGGFSLMYNGSEVNRSWGQSISFSSTTDGAIKFKWEEVTLNSDKNASTTLIEATEKSESRNEAIFDISSDGRPVIVGGIKSCGISSSDGTCGCGGKCGYIYFDPLFYTETNNGYYILCPETNTRHTVYFN